MENRNVLIVCGDWYAKADGDINIARAITKELVSERYSVTVLSKVCNGQGRISDENGYRLYCFQGNEALDQFVTKYDTFPKKKKIRSLFLHPRFLLTLLYMKIRSIRNTDELYYVKHIRSLLKKQDFSKIIGISYPNEAAEAIGKFTKKTKTVWLQLDACAESRSRRILSNVSGAVVPFEICHDYLNKSMPYMSKVRASGIPNICKPFFREADDNVVFPEDTINVAFIGRLYAEIRRPEPLLKIFDMLQDDRIAFHMIGAGCEEVLAPYQKKYPDRFFVHGEVSLEAALNAMQAVDFLVNIDNEKTHKCFFPSKINDYLSTGKPIINIYSNPDSAVLAYLADYENIYHVDADQIDSETIEGLKDFLDRTKGKTIPFEEICKLYYQSTPQYVCGLLSEIN